MKLIVISNADGLPDEAAIINELFEGGLTSFNLRKPEVSRKGLEQLICQINPAYYPRIALHQFHELAADVGITNLHFTEKRRSMTSTTELIKYRDQGYNLSTSVHELKMLREYVSFKTVFYSPVFDSLSKPGYLSRVAPDFWLDKSGISSAIIALGGIGIENILLARAMNFDGAAVLGTIWNEPLNALRNFKKLEEKIKDKL